jgi:hypothetical protein
MPQSFNQFIREEPGPYIDKDSKSKEAHAYHVDQHAHHTKQQKDKKHQGFKQLRRGVIYKSNSGSWVGVKNGENKREYFNDATHATAWVNGTHPAGGEEIQKLDRKTQQKDDKAEKHGYSKDEVPHDFRHPSESKKTRVKSDTQNAKTVVKKSEKKTTVKEKTSDQKNKHRQTETVSIEDAQNSDRVNEPIGKGKNLEEFLGNIKFATEGPPPPRFKIPNSLRGKKVSSRVFDLIERMANCEARGAASGKYQNYSDVKGGAGKIFAQAGELMAMAMSTMDDKNADQFRDVLKKYNEDLENTYPDYKKDKKGKIKRKKIIDDSWVDAAHGNRKAIHNYLKKEYGEGAEIEFGCWDTKEDVEAMWGEGYDENKGYSTDVFFRVKGKGGSFLHEVSLKKSTLVNFLNSGTGKFEDWDDKLPDNIKGSLFGENQRNRLVEAVTKHFDKINPNEPPLSDLMKTKGVGDLKELITNKKEGGKWDLNRDKSKVLLTALNQVAQAGDKEAKQFLKDHRQVSQDYQNAAVEAILENPKLTEGMMTDIKGNFPLKGVSEREEVMAIGDLSLDPHTMKHIFGTDDYSQISERFEPLKDKNGNPYIGYNVEGSDEVIPVAGIGIREDGNGYGGQFKFEMVLHKGFAEHLKNANDAIYGNKKQDEQVKYKSIAHGIHEILQTTNT